MLQSAPTEHEMTILRTGIWAFDDLLEGGLVCGEVTELVGVPGIGKSLLCASSMLHVTNLGGIVLYVTNRQTTPSWISELEARQGRFRHLDLGWQGPVMAPFDHDLSAFDMVVMDEFISVGLRRLHGGTYASNPSLAGQHRLEKIEKIASIAARNNSAIMLISSYNIGTERVFTECKEDSIKKLFNATAPHVVELRKDSLTSLESGNDRLHLVLHRAGGLFVGPKQLRPCLIAHDPLEFADTVESRILSA